MKRDREQGGLLGNIIWEGVLKCGEVEPDSARGGEGRGGEESTVQRIYNLRGLEKCGNVMISTISYSTYNCW